MTPNRLIPLTLGALSLALVGQSDCGSEPEPPDDDLGYTCDVDFPLLPDPPTAERSFFALPTSNGFVSATYAIDLEGVPVKFANGSSGVFNPSHRLITLTDHVMAQPTPSTFAKDFLYDLYLGVRVDGEGTWLGDVAEARAAYVEGTGIIALEQHVGGARIDTYIFAPFHGGTHSLVVLGKVTNTTAEPLDADLYSLINAHAGGEGSASSETVSAIGAEGILETRGSGRLYYQALEDPSHRSAGPPASASNPYVQLNLGRDLNDGFVSGDDVAAGFQWDLGDGQLAPGASGWGGFVVGLNGGGESTSGLVDRVSSFIDGRDSEGLFGAETAFWDAFHGQESWPAAATADELAVLKQATAVLKMGQVREPGPGYGQILASLPPGGWNISWPRDAAYAIVGLVEAGHYDEAKAALTFMIEGDAGDYADALGIGGYLISACRYYGDGTEESDDATCPDGSAAGPNIELDDFGLFLWAYEAYIQASGDAAFQSETQARVMLGVADVLVDLIEEDSGLLPADSSIWERHWEDCFPNGRKHFTYSDVMAVVGLEAAGRLTGKKSYDDAARRITEGLLNLQTGSVFEVELGGQACPAFASAREEICDFCGPWDGSVVEAIGHGVIRPGSAVARGTMRGLMENLASGGGSPGFLRSDDGSGTTNPSPWYDDQEWVVIDLRMAAAMAHMGQATGNATLVAGANTLVSWITAQARANADLIPELLSDGVYTAEDDADHANVGADGGHEYQGSAPMTGFGPGAYILAVDAIRGE